MTLKYLYEYGLEKRVAYAVNGANTIENLQHYLAEDPHPQYHLVSCLHMPSSNWLLIWELLQPKEQP